MIMPTHTGKEPEAREETPGLSVRCSVQLQSRNRNAAHTPQAPNASLQSPRDGSPGENKMYSVSARDLGTFQTLTHSREAHLTSFSHHLGQSMSLICRE